MSETVLADSPAAAPKVLMYVGFWRRFWATWIDAVLELSVTMPILLWHYGLDYFEMKGFVHGPVDFVVNYVNPAIATLLFWRLAQATPGKMAFHAKVVDARTGARPSVGQCLIRYLGYFLSLLPFCLGYLSVAWDPRKQAWHDKLAGTVVVAHAPRRAQPVRFPSAT